MGEEIEMIKMRVREKMFWRVASFLFGSLLAFLVFGQFMLEGQAQGYYDPCTDINNPYGRVDCAFAKIATPSYGRGGYYGGQQYPYGYRQGYSGLTVCDYTECRGLMGTFHAHKGELHFRPNDPTNRRMGVLTGGALGAGGGAIIGDAVGDKKARSIGAVGGAIVGGLIANSRQHNNCLVIRSSGLSNDQIEGIPTAEQVAIATVATVAQAEASLEKKFFWNDFESVSVGVFFQNNSGSQYIEAGPGQRIELFILPGSDIGVMALGLVMPDGRNVNMELRYGNGKQKLPANSGWRVFNPERGGY